MAKKVLIVEDEEDLIFLVENRLKQNGYQVITATTGREALQKFRDEKPDLILFDVVLPDMDGFEACRIIKKDYRSKVKVLAYTGKLSQVDAQLARQSGADELIVKTEDLKTVVENIRNLIGD